MDKGRIAEILSEIGTLLELKGEVVFKTRAYANAARALEGLTEPLELILAENRLGEIKGIGEALQKKSPNWPRPGSWPIMTNLRRPFRPACSRCCAFLV